MSSEILKRDQNHVTVLAGVTDDSDQDVTMLRVDPITKRLLIKGTISGGGIVTSVTATSPITSSGGATPNISTSLATNKLVGRATAGTGVFEAITLGTNLSFTGTTLNAAGGTPASPDTSFQFNDGGVFGGNANAKFDKTTGQSLFGQPTEDGYRVEINGRTVTANCSGDADSCATFPNAAECGGQSGCVVNMDNCSQFTTSQGCDGYPGECTTNTIDCSTLFNPNNAAECSAHPDCTPNFGGSCADFNNTDEATCETDHDGCTWNPGDDTCNGNYITACDGGVVFDSCTGTFFTNCSGTPDACDTFMSQGACVAQLSCQWNLATIKGLRAKGKSYFFSNFTPTNLSDNSQLTAIFNNTDTTNGKIGIGFANDDILNSGILNDKLGNIDVYTGVGTPTQKFRFLTGGGVVIGGTTAGSAESMLTVIGGADTKLTVLGTSGTAFTAQTFKSLVHTNNPYFEIQYRPSNTQASNEIGFNFNNDASANIINLFAMNGMGQARMHSSHVGWFTAHAGTTAFPGFVVPSGTDSSSVVNGAFEFDGTDFKFSKSSTRYMVPLVSGAGVQGDIPYASAASIYSRLAKNTTATRYLSNTGSSNNPAWAQVDVTNGITGAVPVANGGTGATTLVGAGVALVVGKDRSIAQTAAKALATYTVPASDSSFLVSSNVLVTTSTLHSFSVTVSYTDESNTARVLTLNFSQLSGAFVTTLTNALGAGVYEGVPVHIRCKASTTIIVASTGTFTTVTYNLEEMIQQIA